jgi:APA family basic amino acid/polyamine antiporter
VDLRGAIGFSSLGVLIYYAIANAAAWRQGPEARRTPRAVQVVGLLGCLVLVATLPVPAILVGVAVFAVGLAGRWLLHRRRRDDTEP